MGVPGLILLLTLQALRSAAPLPFSGNCDSFPTEAGTRPPANPQALAAESPGNENTLASHKALCIVAEALAAPSPASALRSPRPPGASGLTPGPPRGRAPPPPPAAA